MRDNSIKYRSYGKIAPIANKESPSKILNYLGFIHERGGGRGGAIKRLNDNEIQLLSSIHFWLVRKSFYIGYLWEIFLVMLLTEKFDWTREIFLMDNHYETIFRPVRDKCSSFRMCRGSQLGQCLLSYFTILLRAGMWSFFSMSHL